MKNLKILAYHKVNPVEKDSLSVAPSSFERQVLYLKNKGYSFMTLAELFEGYLREGIGAEIDKKICCLTFDDGYLDNYNFAFKILRKYGIKATIFLTYNFIGQENMLTRKEIKEMKDYGFEFGGHTLSHPDLTKITQEKAEEEIKAVKERLEALLGCEVVSFCYPFGYFNQKIIDIVKAAGYKLAVVTPRKGRIKETIFTLRRIGVYKKDETPGRFKLKMSAVFDILRELKFLV